MKRITLRVPDHQHAALSRVLALEKVERGNRYSLNDLCVRLLMVQLSHTGASAPRTGAPAPLGDGTVHMIRSPGPPPVPRVPPLPTVAWQFHGAEEPQPERSAKPQRTPEEQVDYEFKREVDRLAHPADGADQEANESASPAEDEPWNSRWEDEGGPDGH